MKRKPINELTVTFPSLPENEGMARTAAGIFLSQMNPTVEELADIKCAVSEAVTNAIVHGYKGCRGIVKMQLRQFDDRVFSVEISDKGVGIEDVSKAMEPLFTTDSASERSGMGFCIMESFTDKVEVKSSPGKGCRVTMTKKLSPIERVSDLSVHR